MITIIAALDSMSSVISSLPSVVLWLAGIVLALTIFSIFFKSLRKVVYRLAQAGLIVLFFCGLLVGSYIFFFDRCDTMVSYDDGSSVRLIGICREVEISPRGDGRRASFLLRDPTGNLRVVTTSGAPSEGSVIYLRGRKGTYSGDSAFVVSDYQLSPF